MADFSQEDRWRVALVMALSAGDLERAAEIVRDSTRDIPPVAVLDEVLAPAMHEIGELWERNEITVADEHLATFVTHRLLAEVASTLRVAAPASRAKVLLAAPPPERHTAGMLMAYDVLRGAGYSVLCLGGGVPQSALVGVLERHRPRLVGLSTTMPFVAELTETIDLVFDVLPDVQVIVGGGAADTLAPRERVHRVRRMVDLPRTAERVLEGRPG